MESNQSDDELSDAARDLDDEFRGAISDLTEHDVRRRARPDRRWFPQGMTWQALLALFMALIVVVFSFAFVAGLFRGGDETSAAQTSAAQTSAAQTPAGQSEAGSGPIAGTWRMYTTGSDVVERHAYTIRFGGGTTGTLDVLEDATEYDTTFTVETELVTFTFTRVLDVEAFGSWPEESVFTGRLDGEHSMRGTYERQGWSCDPTRDPPCAYDGEWVSFVARLERQE